MTPSNPETTALEGGTTMNNPSPAPDLAPFELAHCSHCQAWSYPPDAWGCRRCGAPALSPVAAPQEPVLLEFVTLHTALTTHLPVPCVIADVQLAPGVIEEALIATDNTATLSHGMRLRAERAPAETGARWWFRPVEARS